MPDTKDNRKCPLNGFEECLRNDCMWYIPHAWDDRGKCSVSTIADTLDNKYISIEISGGG